ncbi:TIGR02281 family clan AA aspartic protease [Lampropedia puyangensis]|uniref:TIGR02281 family clan AA aspartic protease n=1 Tax=Lampropedia puyangensis TaxID=1330072 RepID=A0A4S8F1H6_9BURK|nr:retropepsin-like aspartic protease [Lampropedia puyangensis]THT99933.1 TIGR02281 family clan AA aspartic protease [Lampropedia puyangensis]
MNASTHQPYGRLWFHSWLVPLGLCGVLASSLPSAASAQDLRLVGTVGTNRAIVVLGDGKSRTLTVGQPRDGITLLSIDRNTATFATQGEKLTLTVGQTPTRLSSHAAQTLKLPAQPGGHYYANGQINGQNVQFLVDTGASTVSLDAQLAARLGIDFQKGRSITVNTANGQTQGWLITLPNLRVGELQQHNVSATIVQQPMPFALLGNSFLNHYRMTRDATSMVLEPR